jgi:AAA domain
VNGQAVDIGWLLTRLHKVDYKGTAGWKACCPAHDDHNPSLSIDMGDDGRILLHCFRGCSVEQITEALGIRVGQLFPDPIYPPRRRHRSADPQGLRTRGVIWERVRPVSWLWDRRIPCGLPSLIVGAEDIGKGTIISWIAARATRGELEGDLQGEPITVLIIGDEDGFETIWIPRLHAAGADLERVRTLDDGEHLDDFRARAADLSLTVERDQIGFIVFDQVLDHVAGGENGSGVYNPKNVREAMLPLRRVTGEHAIAATGLLHPVKGRPKSFRDLIAGSHQFNAVSRSSLLLGQYPQDRTRRVLVRGKGNHSAAPRSFEFRIAVDRFDLNGHGFEMPVVADAVEGSLTVEDLLNPEDAPVRNELAERLAGLLTDKPQRLTALAQAVGRKPKDGSVRRALQLLADQDRAEQTEGGWIRAQVPSATPNGDGTGTTVGRAPNEAPADDDEAE